MALILIPCGAKKLAHAAPASELYVGPYSRACLKFARELVDDLDIRIISGKYGLMRLTRWTEPYEHKLKARAWRQLSDLMRAQAGELLEATPVLAMLGHNYSWAVHAVWPEVHFLLDGVGGIGKQLAWLKHTDPGEIKSKYLEVADVQ